ncbi:Carbohydrate ABC transporter permease OS=Streptomyces alboniger OX=132473 GN=CP975_12575 PE=3 SV=1 [Streptomyces alboniger]
MLNTTIVAGSITIGTVLFSTVAGFAFAKLKFRFSGALLLLTIGTMMVPPQPQRRTAVPVDR